MWIRLSGVAALIVLVTCGASAQQPFRSTTALVPLFATVTDRNQHFVDDLSADDFEILDDGKPRPLAFFANTIQPVAVVVLLDTSLGTTLALEQIQEAAEQFVLRLLPGDQARICAFNDKIQFSPAFTNNRDALARSIRNIDFGNGSRLYDALLASVDALTALDAHRVILVFTDGYDTASRTKLRTVINQARARDVSVYAVGLEDRDFFTEEDDDSIAAPPDSRVERLAIETGGAYFELEGARTLEATFTRVALELHRQYVLGFAPTLTDGRVHKIDIHLKNRRLRVRTRQSYLAAPH